MKVRHGLVLLRTTIVPLRKRLLRCLVVRVGRCLVSLGRLRGLRFQRCRFRNVARVVKGIR